MISEDFCRNVCIAGEMKGAIVSSEGLYKQLIWYLNEIRVDVKRGEEWTRVFARRVARMSTTCDRGKTELRDDRNKINSHEFDDHELEYVEKKALWVFTLVRWTKP